MRIRGRLDHYNLLEYVDNFRFERFRIDNERDRRKSLGQFFTPIEVARQITDLVQPLPASIRILDPGAGAGMLSSALVSRILADESFKVSDIEVVACEIDHNLSSNLVKALEMCRQVCEQCGITFTYKTCSIDFIKYAISELKTDDRFDIAILNPPYRKIKSGGKEWEILRYHNLPRSNLYTVFMTLASLLLKKQGQLLSITPRSFCNGPYFLPFRKAFLSQMTIAKVHIYNSRITAFGDDGVLQENVIIGALKNRNPVNVVITSNDGPSDDDVSVQTVQPEELVSMQDRNLVIYLTRNANERRVNKCIRQLDSHLSDLDVDVSTGRVVDFRSRHLLRLPHDLGSVPLIHPAHLVNGFVQWPNKQCKKPSAIDYSGSVDRLLLRTAIYVLVKRFSSKEQRRRLAAAVLDPSRLQYDHIGIENHLNYFHSNGSGLSANFAKGLAAYLNSSIVDQFFRLFSGHTQVNASDLRNLRYPDAQVLERIGKQIGPEFPSEEVLDRIVIQEMGMQENLAPRQIRLKIEGALEILAAVDVPRGQQNNRSALTLLSLVNITPNDDWKDASAPLRRISEMIEFFDINYGITYAPNTRETVRRQTIHPFWQMGLVIHNPDQPERPINSPFYCYQISDTFLELVRTFHSPIWPERLIQFKIEAGDRLNSLRESKREMTLIPVALPDGRLVQLTSGGQNELIKRIVEDFCPRFAPGCELLYIGDAGDKLEEGEISRFQALGIELDRHGKTPDVILFVQRENWLILIEAVTSHGPIDRKRHNELRQLFDRGGLGLVFVTAFHSRRSMAKYVGDISWETEVWIADTPDHLIHFDGERFLGPY